MARATRCDRCDQFEDGEPVAGVTFLMPNPNASQGSSARTSNQIELCSPCMAELIEWRDAHKPAPEMTP